MIPDRVRLPSRVGGHWAEELSVPSSRCNDLICLIVDSMSDQVCRFAFGYFGFFRC